MKSYKVLHTLSQRPSLTGSGVTLDALVRHASRAGWDQCVVVGVPVENPHPAVGGLAPDQIHPLVFGTGELDFPVSGMSDVMPYPSTRFSEMTLVQLDAYCNAWRIHLQQAIADFQPDVIHAHHVWLLSSLLKDVAPEIPVVNQCHATGLRQMTLCPHLADEVKSGCSRNDRFLVLHRGHAEQLAQVLDVPHDQIHVVGAGYREDLFHADGSDARQEKALLYVGKYSAAKGLPWLLDAVERLAERVPGLVLHVAGSGAGSEAEALRQRMQAMAPTVVLHGQIGQPELASLMRRCSVGVLPSFYEGVPLVLVEALACGCRLVSTNLPGVVDQLVPHLGPFIELVSLPRLVGADSPVSEDLPAFVNDLTESIEIALSKSPLDNRGLTAALEPFTWSAVFRRVERVWLKQLI
ncbi:MAG: glycosyltransferase family 4 protein [Chloroflexi bacterium]|nr:glycosyltransferase family 4 protein [Chloroflexota bacterium]